MASRYPEGFHDREIDWRARAPTKKDKLIITLKWATALLISEYTTAITIWMWYDALTSIDGRYLVPIVIFWSCTLAPAFILAPLINAYHGKWPMD